MKRKVQQMFPRRVGDRIERHSWPVDLEAASPFAGFDDGARLLREVEEMAEHLPRWLLTVAHDVALHSCPSCEGLLVFDRGLRCVLCQRPLPRRGRPRALRLAWFGLLPPIGLAGLPKILRGLQKHTPPQHVVGEQPGLGPFLLVPLVAVYPPGFPRQALQVAYLPGFFSIKGIPGKGMSHAYHMLDKGRMCLFAPGQWSAATSCREVLQQRAYPHVVKFLNYGNGKRSAFAKVS